jgi:hypothetical protein
LPQISIKAFVISNFAWLAMALTIFVLLALVVLLIACVMAGLPADIKPIADELKTSSLFVSLISALAIIPASVAAGYLAGRIARRGPALNGALSTFAWIAILIYVALGGGPSNEPPHAGPDAGSSVAALLQLIQVPGAPVLGALGGLLARRRRRDASGGEATMRAVQLAQRF